MTSPATVPAPPPEPLSQVERVIDTFVAPTKTFSDLRRSANWLVPFLLIVIFTEALVVMADKKLGFEKVAENYIALRPKSAAQLDKLSPEDRATQMQAIAKYTMLACYFSPVTIFVVLLIVSAILLGTFNFGLGTELTFNQCIAVVMYASLPGIIKSVLGIVVLAMGAGEGFVLENPVASNLSPLVDPSSHFLYALALNLDLFAIWTLVLSGIGFACLAKRKTGPCMAVVFGWWGVFVLGRAAFVAAFS
jgi:Yip1 domain